MKPEDIKTTEDVIKTYTLLEMIEMLPAEIIHKKKTFFYSSEAFELAIRKGTAFGTWTVEYYNDRTVRTYYQVQRKDLPLAIAEMLIKLAQETYIKFV